MLEPEPCSWNSGIGAVYDDRLGATHVFVTPPVRGGHLPSACRCRIPLDAGSSTNVRRCWSISAGEFAEVQYFFSYPPIDFYAWARVRDGRLVRAFAVTDEGIVWNKGRTSKEERELGLKLFELRGVQGRKGDAGGELILHPTEDHVMRVAHRWSLDPTTLHIGSAGAELGYIALAPAAWRAERARRIA